jgi:hypothetical protein
LSVRAEAIKKIFHKPLAFEPIARLQRLKTLN